MMSCYIHIPFCEKICSYCDFCKMFYNENIVDNYLEQLEKEIRTLYKGEELKTIYIGGGTPSCLSVKQLEKLCEYFKVDMTYFIMTETTDSCLDLIEKAKLLFSSKELSNAQKEELFTSIMKIYLDSKEN